MTGTLVIVGVFLVANLKWADQVRGHVRASAWCSCSRASRLLRYFVPVVPLQPALQSYWLVIHIIVAVLGTAFFALGFALSGLQLLAVPARAPGGRVAAPAIPVPVDASRARSRSRTWRTGSTSSASSPGPSP
ncbi:cytochrome c biogenesis protein CcsA [Leifsonia sp. L25]|uniref:cytochrome c biogenesis protein CcsA n=1 Tax=Leifsonia sp. L25 TaxID=3423957 RepID=UPI003D69CD1A